MNLKTLVWLALYIAMVAAIVIGFRRGRAFADARYSSPTAQTNWDQWRDDVQEYVDKKEGPTERKVPKSDRSPAIVLMDDYYEACLVFSIVLSSALFVTIMFVTNGAMKPTVIRED